MKLDEVLELTGTGKKTIYRWMEKHPKLDTAVPDSPLGHPFPKPVSKDGREVVWDRQSVLDWWRANEEAVGRHPGSTIIMPWSKFRAAMLKEPRVFAGDDGSEMIDDDMDMVESFDRKLDDVRVRFRSVEDAILFKLKYR